ncbi:isocitrate lyase/phosphoenolpyruvate mutase family protein [Amycolatopsis sp. NPDC058986]|uniref:isocitrate lyase/PEP mutase family protein n=1 Tax=unclassified Amycolatopsis TaxID=2618356 RepID=UPI00366C2F36
MTDFTAFRDLHVPGTPLLLPNTWDFGFGALLAQQGFPAIATTSLGVAAAAGEPDSVPSGRAATVALARTLARLDVLLTVDIGEGFSADPGEVADLVEELAGIGVAGVNLEDWRVADGRLADVDAQCALIRAVKDRVPDLFLNARTDTHLGGDHSADTAAERVRAYAGAGADGVFVPGLVAPEDVERVVSAAGVPVNLLFIPGAVTLAGLADLGVARVSVGSLPYRVALVSALETVRAVRDGGELPAKPLTFDEIAALVG